MAPSEGRPDKAPLAERLQALYDKESAKVRARASRAGVATDGALYVAEAFKSGAHQYLLVFSDRVEIANAGQVGTIFRKGKGVQSILLSSITSVESRQSGIYCVLEFRGSGASLDFRASAVSGPVIRDAVAELLRGDASKSPDVPKHGADAIAQLRRLAELRDTGVITEAEFSSKKSKLLDRI